MSNTVRSAAHLLPRNPPPPIHTALSQFTPLLPFTPPSPSSHPSSHSHLPPIHTRQVGGNSAKASSGINGCCPQHSRDDRNANDTVAAFAADTAKSAKREAAGLLQLLAEKSAAAIDWLLQVRAPAISCDLLRPPATSSDLPRPYATSRALPCVLPPPSDSFGSLPIPSQRTSIDLSKLAQLGGHSQPRTHRPANGMIGGHEPSMAFPRLPAPSADLPLLTFLC